VKPALFRYLGGSFVLAACLCVVLSRVAPLAVAAESSLAEALFEFSKQYNPNYDEAGKLEFERLREELELTLPRARNFSRQLASWSQFLFTTKKMNVLADLTVSSETAFKPEVLPPIFIDEVVLSRGGTRLAMSGLWAALAESLDIPFRPVMSPGRPFLQFGNRQGDKNVDLEKPNVGYGLQFFVRAVGLFPKELPAMRGRSAYFKPLAPAEFVALFMHQYAVRLFRQGETEQALDMLNEAIQRLPGIADMHADLGLMLKASGRKSEAVRAFKTALDIFPKDPQVLRLMRTLSCEQGHIKQCKDYAERILEMYPDDIGTLKDVILVTVLRDGLNRARHDIEELFERLPNDPEAKLLNALLQYFHGDQREAKKTFKEIVAENGSNARVLVIYGLRYFIEGVWALEGFLWKAMEQYRRAEALDPDNWLTHYMIGLVYLHANHYADAERIFKSLLNASPQSTEAALQLARALIEQADYEPADVLLKQFKDADLDLPVLYFTQALLYFRQGNLDEAVEFMEKAVSETEYFERDYWKIVLSEIYIEAGRVQDASDTLRNVIEEHPRSPRGNLLLGRIHMSKAEWDLAGRRLRLASQGTIKNGEALKHLARLEFELENDDDAWRYIRAAQREGQQDPELMGQLRGRSKEPKEVKIEHMVVPE